MAHRSRLLKLLVRVPKPVRIDNGTQRGYRVRQGKGPARIERWFSDRKHGGRGAARKAAERFVDNDLVPRGQRRLVTRIETETTSGFRVRVVSPKGEYRRWFADKAYGGRRAAQVAAEAFAKRVVLDGPPREPRRRYAHSGPIRSASGERGVARTGKRGCAWQAYWYDPPGTRIRVYCGVGEAGFALAVATRRQAMRDLQVRVAGETTGRRRSKGQKSR